MLSAGTFAAPVCARLFWPHAAHVRAALNAAHRRTPRVPPIHVMSFSRHSIVRTSARDMSALCVPMQRFAPMKAFRRMERLPDGAHSRGMRRQEARDPDQYVVSEW